jgi:hypothetical protein
MDLSSWFLLRQLRRKARGTVYTEPVYYPEGLRLSGRFLGWRVMGPRGEIGRGENEALALRDAAERTTT